MQTCLVTGGATGIGKAVCRKFASEGYNVAIAYNTSEKEATELERRLTECGYNVKRFCADISVEAERVNLVEQVNRRFGGVDVLINNAGVSHFGTVQTVTEDVYNRLFDVNMKAAFFLTNAVLPHMISNKRGSIVNVSSVWGISGASCEVLYSATKAALIGYTKALAKELGPSSVTVNAVAAGVIDTKMNARLTKEDLDALKEQTPLMKIGSPEDVANAVYYLATQNFVTGQVLTVDGGFLGV